MKLSIVLGTLNRMPLLAKCLPSIHASAAGLPYEIVVVDGGSDDGTQEYLLEQPRTTILWQRQRLGAVRAFNAGFAAAQGEYVANLNDDALVRGSTLADACHYLDSHPNCGQVAIPFYDPGSPPKVERVMAGRRRQEFIYANFGVTRRRLGERLGWWGTYHHYGGDTELSLNIWKAGFTVDILKSGLIEHFRTDDATRVQKYSNRDFKRKWEAWDGTISQPDLALV